MPHSSLRCQKASGICRLSAMLLDTSLWGGAPYRQQAMRGRGVHAWSPTSLDSDPINGHRIGSKCPVVSAKQDQAHILRTGSVIPGVSVCHCPLQWTLGAGGGTMNGQAVGGWVGASNLRGRPPGRAPPQSGGRKASPPAGCPADSSGPRTPPTCLSLCIVLSIRRGRVPRTSAAHLPPGKRQHSPGRECKSRCLHPEGLRRRRPKGHPGHHVSSSSPQTPLVLKCDSRFPPTPVAESFCAPTTSSVSLHGPRTKRMSVMPLKPFSFASTVRCPAC
jgi:hypothetical protein